MPIKPRDFQEQALKLIKGDVEVDHRSAVSRSYYCALHSCINLCAYLPGGFQDDASTSHQSVIDQLRACPAEKPFASIRTDILGLATQLRKGKTLRNRADYKLHLAFDLVRAQEHVKKMGMIKVRADHLVGQLSSAASTKSA